HARTIGDSYGVDVIGRIVRDRRAGRAIAREAERRNSQIIVMGAPRRRRAQGPVFGGTTDYVLKQAPCRVMVVAARAAAWLRAKCCALRPGQTGQARRARVPICGFWKGVASIDVRVGAAKQRLGR